MTPVSETRAKVLVHLVDANAKRRQARARIIAAAGYRLHAHADNDSLIAALGNEPFWVCIVADVANPALDGPALLSDIKQERLSLPVILIDGDTSVSTVGRLFRDGAADYLVRPVPAESLVEAIEDAVALQGDHGLWTGLPADRAARLASLTPAERRVMDAILHGATTRGVAEAFGISPRTVEIHRNRVFVKLGAANVAQLVRIVVSDLARLGVERAAEAVEAGIEQVEAVAEAGIEQVESAAEGVKDFTSHSGQRIASVAEQWLDGAADQASDVAGRRTKPKTG